MSLDKNLVKYDTLDLSVYSFSHCKVGEKLFQKSPYVKWR